LLGRCYRSKSVLGPISDVSKKNKRKATKKLKNNKKEKKKQKKTNAKSLATHIVDLYVIQALRGIPQLLPRSRRGPEK